jgi:hypothetical protein
LRLGLIVAGFGALAICRADYILDTPLSDYILDGPSNPQATWFFNDVAAAKPGQQIRADYRLVNGNLQFFTSSTVTRNGVAAGEKVFSNFGTNVSGIQYSFVNNGKLYVHVALTNGSTMMLSPNFQHGVTTNAQALQTATPSTDYILDSPVGAGARGAGYTYADADYILDGVQVSMAVGFDEESGVVKFTSTSTVDEVTGDRGRRRVVSKFGGAKNRVTRIVNMFVDTTGIYVAAVVSDKKGDRLVILTTDFEPGTATKVITPDADYILD